MADKPSKPYVITQSDRRALQRAKKLHQDIEKDLRAEQAKGATIEPGPLRFYKKHILQEDLEILLDLEKSAVDPSSPWINSLKHLE